MVPGPNTCVFPNTPEFARSSGQEDPNELLPSQLRTGQVVLEPGLAKGESRRRRQGVAHTRPHDMVQERVRNPP
ncbi:MAG: hypothetical protein DMG13_04065 [Acidobacteria bacterium]|nr:MAG: hypothetical protein DMG13_04065 [Acidobacteriota bacterium]